MSITATARTADRTGVEMEALTAVTVAALALIDMIKAVDPAAVITDVRVEEKTGGKTGAALASRCRDRAARRPGHHGLEPGRGRGLRGQVRAGAGGTAGAAGCEVDGPLVVPDGDPVEEALRDGGRAGYDG